jgi:hypothetical protein
MTLIAIFAAEMKSKAASKSSARSRLPNEVDAFGIDNLFAGFWANDWLVQDSLKLGGRSRFAQRFLELAESFRAVLDLQMLGDGV